MQFFTLLMSVGLAAVVADAMSLNGREELMQLKQALRSQLDELERQERNNAEEQTFDERSDVPSEFVGSESVGSELTGSNVAGCPNCADDSVCCRKGDEFQCCAKIYPAQDESLEFDTEHNIAVAYQKNGTTQVFDFNKGILSVYEPKSNACYIAGGLDYTLEDLKAVLEGKATKDNKAGEAEYYESLEAKPLEDHSILPTPHQAVCEGKPVYWHVKSKGNGDESAISAREVSGLQRRGFWKKVKSVWKDVVKAAKPIIIQGAKDYLIGALSSG